MIAFHLYRLTNHKPHQFLQLIKEMDPSHYEFVVGNDEYKNGKPDPEPILCALNRMGVSPDSHICYIGDSHQDIECAKAAGVDAIFISRNGNDNPPTRPEALIQSLKELLLR